jgi:hypothetical protein
MANGLKRHYGNPVSGDRFWPRPDITRPTIQALLAGESIKLFGLRRTGKSSIMLEVEAALRKAGRKPVYVDVQGNDRVDQLCARLLAALPASDKASKITHVLTSDRVSKGIKVVQRILGREQQGPPQPAAVLQQIELIKGDLTQVFAQQNGAVILLIDELPFLIDNMLDRGVPLADVNAFLATLRSWRQDGQLPMFLSGSIGLSWLIRERGIAREHFNDLIKTLTPPPLEPDDARAMLAALAVEEDCPWMTSEIVAVVLEESAVTYPSFLQFAFGRLKDRKARTVADVRRIFEMHIRPSLDEDFYAQFDTRLNRFGAEHRAAARDVLRLIDKNGDGPTELAAIDHALSGYEAVDRDDILSTLVEDGFIATDTKAQIVAFSSPLIRTWWQSKPYRR